MQSHADILAALAAPFDPRVIDWRVGHTNPEGTQSQALAFVDKYVVMQRFDDVLGASWGDEMIVQPNGLVTCRIGILIDGEWRWRQDGTASARAAQQSSNGSDGDKADNTRKMREKATLSDAFKRTARKWGVGRYIETAMPTPWVAVTKAGYGYKFTKDGWNELRDVAQKVTDRIAQQQARNSRPPAPSIPPAREPRSTAQPPPAANAGSTPGSALNNELKETYREMNTRLEAAQSHDALDRLLTEYRSVIADMSTEAHGRWLSKVASKREGLMKLRAA